MNPATIGTLAVIAFLLVVAFLIWRANGRSDQPEPDRLDSMIDVVSGTRDEGNQNLAWPPEAEQPISLVPARPSPHAPVVARARCGCVYRDGLLWLPCSPLAVLQDHINRNADQWAQRLTEEGM